MVTRDTSTVYLFPGQGAQYQGMALDFFEISEPVRKLFSLASETMGRDLQALIREGDPETLKRTDVSQPTITLANLAAAAFLKERGISPRAAAGFSLGEYAALTVAGIISAEDCFRLVTARGKAMQDSADRIRLEGRQDGSAAGTTPGMAAVVGLPPEQVEALVAQWTAAGLTGLYGANFNSPKQVVVSGTAAALAAAEERFKEAGARRFIRLQVAGPFHSPLIADAAEAFGPVLESVKFANPAIPFYSNVSGGLVLSGAEAKKLSLRQITEPVRWTAEEGAIIAAGGIEAALETGPGKVLQGLWKDSGSTLPCYAAGTLEDINKLGE